MKLTNTWRRRLSAAGLGSTKVAVIAVVTLSVISGASTVYRWVFPADGPSVAQTARAVGNQTAMVESYAIDCVTVLLTASTARANEVARCFPDSSDMTLPTTSPLIVSAQSAAATLLGESAPHVQTYGVIVAVTEQSYTNAPPVRSYYQLPVSVYDGGAPATMGKPARRDPPPPGVRVKLDYPTTIPSNDPVAAVVSGFIACYLTDASGIERFVTVDSGLGTLHAYSAATVSSLRSQQPVPEAPDEGQQLRVWATVTARAADYSTTALDYPLTLRATGGSWSVAAIDAVPAMDAQEDPAPMTNTR